MPPPPQPFDPDTYLAWHEAKFPGDAPAKDRLAALRAELVAGSRDQLTALAQVLTTAASHCLAEYQLATKAPTGVFREPKRDPVSELMPPISPLH